MGRTGILALLTAVVVALVSLGSGCGGDSGRAREYTQKGDQLIAAIEKNSEKLGSRIDRAFTSLYGDVSSGKAPDVASFNSSAGRIGALAAEMKVQASKARSFFEKVDSLVEVPYYQKYADLKLQIIDENVKGLEQLEAFLQGAKSRLAASPFDPIAFQAFVTEFGEAVQKLGEEGGKLQEQARELKKEKNL